MGKRMTFGASSQESWPVGRQLSPLDLLHPVLGKIFNQIINYDKLIKILLTMMRNKNVKKKKTFIISLLQTYD